MNLKAKSCLVILNKNESSSLSSVIDEIDRDLFEKIICYDGQSDDHSINILEEKNIPYIIYNKGGRGGSIRHSIKNLNYDFIVFLSSDGEENPSQLKEILNSLYQGNDLVIASRMMEENSGFKSDHNFFYIHRKLFLKFITFLINFLFKGRIKDCWNGYRGVRREAALKMDLKQNYFLLEAEMTIRALKNDFKISEVPTKERKRNHGKSQNPIISSGFMHLILILKEFIAKK